MVCFCCDSLRKNLALVIASVDKGCSSAWDAGNDVVCFKMTQLIDEQWQCGLMGGVHAFVLKTVDELSNERIVMP